MPENLQDRLRQYGLRRPAYRLRHLLEIFPLKRSTIYVAIKRGDLVARKYYGSTLFLAEDVADFIEKLREGKQLPTRGKRQR